MEKIAERMKSVSIAAHDVDYLSTYMDEYYGTLTAENEEIGAFLYACGHTGALLDVACGPSALYWAMFHPGVERFVGIDVREDSLRYLRNVLDRTVREEIDPRYAEIAAWRKHEYPRLAVIDTAAKFADVRVHDAREAWPFADATFDGVVSCFGIDHVETYDHFLTSLREARRVLRPGGLLTLVTLCETASWLLNGTRCACLFTTRELLRRALVTEGFVPRVLEERRAVTAAEAGQGYEKMLFCCAERV